ncbi:MAG: M20/M25/M40 family metallo-hydrolase [Deltaproteobacteria bacterium]|nr:M20/M25/M40 family metallo-hydrolase [Deltaproteobacteria bacterium]
MHKTRIAVVFSLILILTVAIKPALPVPYIGFDVAFTNDEELIQQLVAEADGQRWFQIIRELAENEDIENPGYLFRSRYALRVRDAEVFDGTAINDACDNAAEYIAAKFRSFGLNVEFDSFEHTRFFIEGGKQGEYVMRNVVATLPGIGPNKHRTYLMTAHYDSIASKDKDWEQNWRSMPAPGASDNASGVADILETARILSQQNFDFTIKFIAFSGEELGLFGSKHYAKHVKEQGEDIAGVLNFDMLGHDDDNILDIHVVGNMDSEWLVNAFQTASRMYDIDIEFHKIIDPKFVYSDHAPFWEESYSAVMLSEESSMESPDWPKFIHSAQDNLDKINIQLGERGIQLAVATLSELADPISLPEPTELNPDVAVESDSFILSSSQLAKGDTVNLSASIRNLGTKDVDDIEFWFTVVTPKGETLVFFEQLINLAVGDTKTLHATFRVDDWGIYTLRAIINPNVTFFEPNFENNVQQQHLKVTTSPLYLSDVRARPPLFSRDKDMNLRVSYQLSKDAQVTADIYTLAGELVYLREYAIGTEGGKLGVNDVFKWNGKNTLGERVAPGVYFCNITATDEDGNIIRGAQKIAVLR